MCHAQVKCRICSIHCALEFEETTLSSVLLELGGLRLALQLEDASQMRGAKRAAGGPQSSHRAEITPMQVMDPPPPPPGGGQACPTADRACPGLDPHRQPSSRSATYPPVQDNLFFPPPRARSMLPYAFHAPDTSFPLPGRRALTPSGSRPRGSVLHPSGPSHHFTTTTHTTLLQRPQTG